MPWAKLAQTPLASTIVTSTPSKSPETSLALVDRIPSGVVRVTESGISTADDIARLRAAGFDAFLIGESLMRQPDPGAALADLLAGSDSYP